MLVQNNTRISLLKLNSELCHCTSLQHWLLFNTQAGVHKWIIFSLRYPGAWNRFHITLSLPLSAWCFLVAGLQLPVFSVCQDHVYASSLLFLSCLPMTTHAVSFFVKIRRVMAAITGRIKAPWHRQQEPVHRFGAKIKNDGNFLCLSKPVIHILELLVY